MADMYIPQRVQGKRTIEMSFGIPHFEFGDLKVGKPSPNIVFAAELADSRVRSFQSLIGGKFS